MDFSQYGNVPSNIQDAIMQASNSTGVDPDLLARIARQESGFDPNAVSPAGATGLFQTMPDTARDLGIEDMTNPYQSAMGGAKYIAQNLQKYGGDITKALAAYNAGPGNVDSWISNGWDGSPDTIPIEETRNYVKSIGGGGSSNIPVNYTQQGKSPINLAAQFQLDDPKEQIDFGQVMGILNAPKQNVSAAGDDALRSALSTQAHHLARGKLAAPFYAQSDKQLMQSAIAKAQEEAKLNNQSTQLTGAGQLAQMIANSKNSSNAEMLASLGQALGVRLSPMARRYMSQNDMAKMGLQFARQDQLLADERAFKAAEAEKQRQFQRDMMAVRAAAAASHAGGGGSSGGGGRSGGSSSASLINSDKYVDKQLSGFGEYLNENADKEQFSQSDVNELNRRYGDLILQLGSAEATPYSIEMLRRAGNDYTYQIEHMQNSSSGNKLDYSASQDILDKLNKNE